MSHNRLRKRRRVLRRPTHKPGVIKEQFSRVAAASMDAIIAVDFSQRIILFNPAAEAMFGLSAQKALGQHAHRRKRPRAHDLGACRSSHWDGYA